MPTLNWIGKEAVVNHHNEVPVHTLTHNPECSIGTNASPSPAAGNLLIEGDNLLALKALLTHYAGKVKCIFIDPPYNTGNESWRYNDNVNHPTIQKWLGKTVGTLAVDLSRHDKWLCMMYPRLCLLHQLLRDDGAIFITIDDNEVHHLRMLMDDIFGEDNFVANVTWEKRYGRSNHAQDFSAQKESVLVFRKSDRLQIRRENRTDEAIAKYKNPDNDPRGPWSSAEYVNHIIAKEKRPNLVYPITNPNTGEVVNHPTRAWINSKEKYEAHVRENRLWWGRAGKAKYPRLKRFLSEVKGLPPTDIWLGKETGTTADGTKELKQIFNTESAPFDYPKPTRLIRRIINLVTTPDGDEIILDSFAGSGTTGHAVLAQNQEDGGNRRFILVELDATIASEITAVRLRRVINGWRYENNGKQQHRFGTGGSFAYYRVGETLLEKSEIPFDEMGQYLFFKETGVPMQTDAALALTEREADTYPRKKKAYCACSVDERLQRAFLGSANGIGVYLLNSDDILTEDLLSRLPRHSGSRVIHCGGNRLTDAALRRLGVTFKQMPYHLV